MLGMHEACANAVEHAYRDDEHGIVDVTVRPANDGSLLATIRDFGTGRPQTSTMAERGRGLDLIRTLTADFTYHLTNRGTVVQFRLPAAGAAP